MEPRLSTDSHSKQNRQRHWLTTSYILTDRQTDRQTHRPSVLCLSQPLTLMGSVRQRHLPAYADQTTAHHTTHPQCISPQHTSRDIPTILHSTGSDLQLPPGQHRHYKYRHQCITSSSTTASEVTTIWQDRNVCVIIPGENLSGKP